MCDTVVHLLTTYDLLHCGEYDFDGQKFTGPIDHVERRVEDQVPDDGGQHQRVAVLEHAEYRFAEQEVAQDAARVDRTHTGNPAGQRVLSGERKTACVRDGR